MLKQTVKIEALESQIETEKPLTEFARSVSDCSDVVTVGEYAKMLFDRDGIDIGRNRLYKWMRDHGYFIKMEQDGYQTLSCFCNNSEAKNTTKERMI